MKSSPISQVKLAEADPSTSVSAWSRVDTVPRIGIVSAFGAEADLLIERLHAARTVRINGNRFVVGELLGVPVVVVLCGISIVNAAMVTQLMLCAFAIERLVMSGIAGGVDAHGAVGDVLVPERWALPMEIYWSADGDLPAPCGRPGDLEPLGLRLARDERGQPHPAFSVESGGGRVSTGMHLRDTHLRRAATGEDGEWRFAFAADPDMLEVARSLKPLLSTTGPRSAVPVIDNAPRLRVGGLGASTPAFLANPQYRQYLFGLLDVRVIDMETAALAQVAHANGVPFIAMRSLSDVAGADTSRHVGAFFETGLAELNASAVTLAFIDAWRRQRRPVASHLAS